MIKDVLYKIFLKYKTDIFIETGSHLGYGIDRAIDIGFDQIYSIEIEESYYDHCCGKFQFNANVALYYGSSEVRLPDILSKVNERATFWLDAHMATFGGPCPIITELKMISEHKIKCHNILIDDMRDFGTEAHDYITIQDLKNELLLINPEYTFEFESTGIKDNVLAAYLK